MRIYSIEETIKRLKTYTLSNQISFNIEKSLKCLKYIESREMNELWLIKKFIYNINKDTNDMW